MVDPAGAVAGELGREVAQPVLQHAGDRRVPGPRAAGRRARARRGWRGTTPSRSGASARPARRSRAASTSTGRRAPARPPSSSGSVGRAGLDEVRVQGVRGPCRSTVAPAASSAWAIVCPPNTRAKRSGSADGTEVVVAQRLELERAAGGRRARRGSPGRGRAPGHGGTWLARPRTLRDATSTGPEGELRMLQRREDPDHRARPGASRTASPGRWRPTTRSGASPASATRRRARRSRRSA